MSRHFPLPPETIDEIRSSPETNSAIARRLGMHRQTISKIRLGLIHQPIQQAAPRVTSEESVRLVLSQPPDMRLAEIAELAGLDKETARRIRVGLRFADVAPELPRLTVEQMGRRCWLCVQWEGAAGASGADRYGRCHLGIPEATESQLWARGCGAYAAREEVAGGTTAPAQDEEPSGDATVSDPDL